MGYFDVIFFTYLLVFYLPSYFFSVYIAISFKFTYVILYADYIWDNEKFIKYKGE